MPNAPTELEPIAVPRPRDEHRPAPFPLAASIAPLLASCVLWAVTQSPFALVFALLSPVVAVAGMLDARRHARRRRRDDDARYERELRSARGRLVERHDQERAELVARTPGAAVALGPDHLTRWRVDPARFAVVSLGLGEVDSGARVTGADVDDASGLRDAAAVLRAAPVHADAVRGIGITGPPALARALARGYLIQLADAFAPDRLAVHVDTDSWAWARSLPHVQDHHHIGMLLEVSDVVDAPPHATVGDAVPDDAVPGDAVGGEAVVRAAADARHALLAVAPTPRQLPPGCHVVVAVEGASCARVIAGEGFRAAPFAPELVPAAAAATFAAELRERAREAGLSRPITRLPARAAFDELEQPDGPGLTCAIGVRASGTFTLDLVGSGPHAVVAGTTGSGKSELLVTWVTAMAATRTPDEVAFLLVDFKGGTAFSPLTRLPHTVGVITDLGHGEALRALQSLRAELRRRERLLAESGARDVDQATAPIGRLVIVVDEFAAMLDAFPELSPLFTDLAARGRALGIHLVLCTQRATGVVRDALLANCALRLSLRVTGAADSVAVLGTDAAARLPPSLAGRCIVAHEGEHDTVQIAVTAPERIEAVADRAERAGVGRPPRPWLDPLPALVRPTDLDPPPRGAVAIALCDRPDEQRRHTVCYRPAVEHLFVLGMRGSGKSTLIAAVAAQWPGRIVAVPDDMEGGWDAVQRAEQTVHGEAGTSDEPRGDSRARTDGRLPTVVLIDDLDALLERFDGEHRDVLGDSLLALLRDGPRRGMSSVCTASRLTQAVRPLLPLLGTTIVLGQTSRHEHLLAGAPSHLFEERARPGLGSWHDHRIQLVSPPEVERPRSAVGEVGSARDELTDPAPASDGLSDPAPTRDELTDPAPAVVRFPAGSTTVLVGRAPRRVADRLRHRHGERLRVLDITGVTAAGGTDVLDVAAPGDDGRAAAADAVVLIGDPDAWLAQWPLLTRLRGRTRIVFEGCSVADVRGILRSRVLPPPLASVDGRVWTYDGTGAIERARLW